MPFLVMGVTLLPLLSSLGLAVPTQVVTCDPPPTIVNGNFHPKKESYDYSDIVEYSCQKDYTLSGSRYISCSADGRFEPAPPTCIMVQCKEPDIANAEWTWGSRPPHGYLSTVTYKCKSGYTMIGEATLTCGVDSQWSPGLPTCQRLTRPTAATTTPSELLCEEPVINAEWIGGSRPPYGYQSVVTYMCKSGYTMVGESTLTCGRDGQWSPGLPKCQRRNCSAAEEVDFGHVEYPQGTEFGDELVVTCNPGYRLVGNNKRLCGAQGWMGRMPECEAVTCDPPSQVESGTFSPNKEIYQYGEVVEYSCQNDYTLSGSRTITCSDSERFEPAPPTCVKVQCEEPVIANGMWDKGSRPPHGYLSTVTCRCRPGYTMIREATLTCGVDSQWSPGLPTCQRMSAPTK